MYKIKNLEKFSYELGKLVAKDMGFNKKEFMRCINIHNLKQLVLQYCNKSNDGSYIISDKETSTICNEISNWVIGVDLAKLAADDVIECYWDDVKNTMTFSKKNNKSSIN